MEVIGLNTKERKMQKVWAKIFFKCELLNGKTCTGNMFCTATVDFTTCCLFCEHLGKGCKGCENVRRFMNEKET